VSSLPKFNDYLDKNNSFQLQDNAVLLLKEMEEYKKKKIDQFHNGNLNLNYHKSLKELVIKNVVKEAEKIEKEKRLQREKRLNKKSTKDGDLDDISEKGE